MSTTQMNPTRSSNSYRLFLFVVAASVVSLACATAKQAPNQAATLPTPTPTPALNTTQAPTPTQLQPSASPAAPKLNEVQAAVARVYQDTVAIDTSRSVPFIVGDFNGDGSQDIAVIVRPAKASLAKLNSEYANWIVEEPQRVALPDPNRAVQQLAKGAETIKVQQDDLLLLILHGYRQAGWHDQLARQTFLLRNAVGENIRAQSLREAAKSAGSKNAQTQPPGDVIREKLNGQDGFLYWTNAKYAWHQ